MFATTTRFSVAIDAPDGPAALDLEHRLFRLAPAAIARGSHWCVVIPGDVDVDDIQAAIRAWLHDVGERETTVHLDGDEVIVADDRPRCFASHHATHADFIG